MTVSPKKGLHTIGATAQGSSIASGHNTTFTGYGLHNPILTGTGSVVEQVSVLLFAASLVSD